MSNEEPVIEMPQYQCHKKVRALRIKDCHRAPVADPQAEAGNATLTFEDAGFSPREVKYSVISRYWPKAGDYFVVYDDGYESISPARSCF